MEIINHNAGDVIVIQDGTTPKSQLVGHDMVEIRILLALIAS